MIWFAIWSICTIVLIPLHFALPEITTFINIYLVVTVIIVITVMIGIINIYIESLNMRIAEFKTYRYIARNSVSFDQEDECLEYERILDNIKYYKIYTPLNLDYIENNTFNDERIIAIYSDNNLHENILYEYLKLELKQFIYFDSKGNINPTYKISEIKEVAPYYIKCLISQIEIKGFENRFYFK